MLTLTLVSTGLIYTSCYLLASKVANSLANLLIGA